MNLRRLIHPMYRKLETIAHPLRYLFIEITQRCNLACRHCGSDCSKDAQLPELTTAEWLNFFSYLKEKADTEKMVLVVTGGEPFCHPEFDRILSCLSSRGLSWGMVTNGFALHQDNVNRIVDHGISSVTVSLDGNERTHDWLRGKKGSFRRATAGIERLAKANLHFFDVVTCVHPGNLDQLDVILSQVRGMGVPAWRLFSIFPKGRARNNPELLLSEDQFRQMLDFIRARRKELCGSGFELSFSCEGYLPKALDHQVRDEPYFCRAGISIGSVLCDGSISACPNVSRDLIQGNIRDDDLLDVWENRFQVFRDRAWMKTAACTKCAEWNRCQGNSMHLWDNKQKRTVQCTHKVAIGTMDPPVA